MRICWLFVLLTSVIAGRAACRAACRAAGIDVISYRAILEPDITGRSIHGKVDIVFIGLPENNPAIRLSAGTLVIDSVQAAGTPLAFTVQAGILDITLSRAAIRDTCVVSIVYHGAPAYGIRFFPEQSQVYTCFSTSQWMPCVDTPTERATFRLSLIVPQNLQVAGNGRCLSTTLLGDGKILSVWEQLRPMPAYLFGFCAGKFRIVTVQSTKPVLRYMGPARFSRQSLLRIFANTGDMIAFYESRSGISYSDESYIQILAAGDAEQEMSGFTTLNESYGEDALSDSRNTWLSAHELAHQWWGNMVTNAAWTHFWLNEGTANFMVAAYYEHRLGRKAYRCQINRYRAAYERIKKAGHDRSLVFKDWLHPSPDDRSIVYNKGAYVFHLLRAEIGDTAFWAGLKRYTTQHWGGPVTSADLQEAMEAASGRDLAAFFKRWVYCE